MEESITKTKIIIIPEREIEKVWWIYYYRGARVGRSDHDMIHEALCCKEYFLSQVELEQHFKKHSSQPIKFEEVKE